MLRPLDDKIVIKKKEVRNTSSGGVLLPETVKQEPMEGVVVAVGPGRYEKGKRVSMVLEVGDRVVFGTWAAKEVDVGNEEFLVMREDDIIGVLREI